MIICVRDDYGLNVRVTMIECDNTNNTNDIELKKIFIEEYNKDKNSLFNKLGMGINGFYKINTLEEEAKDIDECLIYVNKDIIRNEFFVEDFYTNEYKQKQYYNVNKDILISNINNILNNDKNIKIGSYSVEDITLCNFRGKESYDFKLKYLGEQQWI